MGMTGIVQMVTHHIHRKNAKPAMGMARPQQQCAEISIETLLTNVSVEPTLRSFRGA
jgi:hypothetical protein